MIALTCVEVIGRTRLPAGPEKDVQAAIGDALATAGIEFIREYRLSDADVIDFLVQGVIGIEVKIKGARRAILRQLERYAEHPQIGALALVSSVATGLPPQLHGKPVHFVSIGRAWL